MCIAFNHSMDPSSVRTEILDEVEYWVAPVTLITEGIHAGSLGPVFYPSSEIEASAPAWNMKPIVVRHPVDKQGNFISAASVDVLKKSQVGFLLNVRFDGKLRADAWLDKNRVANVDVRIAGAIGANRVMEVSTGLVFDVVKQTSTFNGTMYNYVAANHRPDHLAILPDQVGACSVKAGCGLLQTNSEQKKVVGLGLPSIDYGGRSNPTPTFAINPSIIPQRGSSGVAGLELPSMQFDEQSKPTPRSLINPALVPQTAKPSASGLDVPQMKWD